jgi:RimJ/RimL family protein N-acetyltransferase
MSARAGAIATVPPAPATIRLRRVATLDDLMALRLLRNECRAWMTGHTAEIGEAEQLVWWQGVAGHPGWRVWLIHVPGWAEPVGFAMLRLGMSYWLATLGLRSWLRGRGLGTATYRALLERCEGDVVAVIRADNEASVRAAVKAGYERLHWDVEGQLALVGKKRG